MPDAGLRRDKLRWIALGGAFLPVLDVLIRPEWGVCLYHLLGVLVAGYWFWIDDTNEKGPRWDIAIALPIAAMFWPALALALPFMKHFRDKT